MAFKALLASKQMALVLTWAIPQVAKAYLQFAQEKYPYQELLADELNFLAGGWQASEQYPTKGQPLHADVDPPEEMAIALLTASPVVRVCP